MCLAASTLAADLDSKVKEEKKPIIITSETLTADNKNNTAVFEGSVVAETSDITMSSDKMTVYYDNSEGKVSKIHAIGNVKVLNNTRVLFSKEAVYIDDEEKIIFSGNPKAVEGDNVITGEKIIFFIKDERAVVESSRVILKNKKDIK
jgi:lipopolysaccharide export system protein LptA